MKHRWYYYIVLLLAVIMLNFFLPRLLPGSPIGQIAGEEAGKLDSEEKARILSAYRLDLPLEQQFLIYLKSLVTFDFGISYPRRQPVAALLAKAIPWTLLLAGTALVLSAAAGTFLGTVSAYKRRKRADLPIMMGATFVSSVPSFWIGMILLTVFGARLGWLPMYGAYSMWKKYTGWRWALDVAAHLVLPVVTMLLASLMHFFTTSRYSVLQTMFSDYVTMAEIRGIPKRRIRIHYVMRNAMLPVFTVFMTELGFLLSGSVIIETVFSYPGIGYLLFEAVKARDYPLMQYGFLASSAIVILAGALSDFLTARIDPGMEEAE